MIKAAKSRRHRARAFVLDWPVLSTIRDVVVTTRYWLPQPHWLLAASIGYVTCVLSVRQWQWLGNIDKRSWIAILAALIAAGFIIYHLYALLKAIRCIPPLAELGKSLIMVQDFRPELKTMMLELQIVDLDGNVIVGEVTHREWRSRRDTLRNVFSDPVGRMQASIIGMWGLHSAIILLQVAALIGLVSLVDPGAFAGINHIRDVTDAVYFTAVTMATIGYGDIHAGNTVGELTIIAVAILTVVLITTAIGLVLRTVNELEHSVASDLEVVLGPTP